MAQEQVDGDGGTLLDSVCVGFKVFIRFRVKFFLQEWLMKVVEPAFRKLLVNGLCWTLDIAAPGSAPNLPAPGARR